MALNESSHRKSIHDNLSWIQKSFIVYVDLSQRKSICVTLAKHTATWSIGRVENVVESNQIDTTHLL